MFTYQNQGSMEEPRPLRLSSLQLDDSGDSGERSTPAVHLLVAIMRRAIWDFVLYREYVDTSNKELSKLAEDAAGWIFFDGEEQLDEEGRMSFLYVCTQLDVDPVSLREQVMGLKREDIQWISNGIKEE